MINCRNRRPAGAPSSALALALAAGLGLGMALAPLSAQAHSYTLGKLAIGHLWAKPAAKGADAVVYAPIFNMDSSAATLVGASSPVAGKTLLRDGTDGADKVLDAIPLPPGKPVALAPWRAHIVLSNLKKTLKKGDAVDLDLDFGAAGKISVAVEIEDEASD
ncbi:copper chaperone PCu(A)C [Jiella sp. M17.18]|uniref:copper chaperone PCu(A)C n=1 Tax=Jiella sp. M17.18 TaxID=3234247 RepID=UPI0034DF0E8B